MSKKSLIWDYFDICDSDSSKGKCRLCHKILSRGGSEKHKMTTTNLRNHIKNVHKELFNKLTSEQDSITMKSLTTIDKVFKIIPQQNPTTNQEDNTEPSSSVNVCSDDTSELKGSKHQAMITSLFARQKPLDDSDPKARKITNFIGEMIALDLQPYSIVVDEGFCRLINHLAPRYKIPSRKTMTERVVPLLYETIKAKVQSEINEADYICLTTDGWTSQHGMHSFYSLTARIISRDFRVRCLILQLTNFSDSHTGKNIADFIKSSLEAWKISENKIQGIIADNAANMKTAMKEANMTEKYLPCAIHTLQLCIQEKLFRQQRSIIDILGILRNLASHLHRSTASMNNFRDIQKQLSVKSHAIIQDVQTRWNSTYDMLERFIEQKKVVILFCLGKNMKCLTDDQWKLAETLVTVLAHFKEATLEMSSDNASVSQIIPFIVSMTNYLQYAVENASGIKTILEELLNDFKKRFDQYRNDINLKHAMILDPRFKLKFIDDNQTEKESITLSLARDFKKLIEIKKSETQSIVIAQGTNISITEDESSSPSDAEASPMKILKRTGDIYSFYQSQMVVQDVGIKRKKKCSSQQTMMEKCLNEIKAYLTLPELPKQDCPYTWWEKYSSPYLDNECSVGLQDLVRKYLCISPTSVMSERLFSTSGNIFEHTRNRLTPEHGEQLAFIHCNFKKYN